MIPLYEVGMRGIQLQEALYESLGEITPELEQAMDELLAQGEQAMENAAWVVRKITADAELCKAEAKRLKERAEAMERSVDGLKGRMIFALDAAFNGKLKTAKNTMWAQNAKPGLVIEEAPDVDLIALDKTDSSLVKKTYSLNTTEIRNRYEAGDALPSSIIVEEKPATRFLRIS